MVMKNKNYYLLIFSLITLFLVSNIFAQDKTEVQNHKSIIKFSHKLHIENEVDCADCHTAVTDAVDLSESLLPTMETCGNCHDIEDEDGCTTCHYKDTFEPFEEEKTSEIKFNHKLHISDENLECTTCHQGLDSVDYAFESTSVFPEMKTCTNCHNDKSVATIECSVCHVNSGELLPESHKLANFSNNHIFAAENGNQDCGICHNNTFCETCHDATTKITETNKSNDFYIPGSPLNFISDKNLQQITLVHGLNYEFTHGIDAKGHEKQCQTCHQPETFCAECHNPEASGGYAMGGFVPYSHTQPNFTTIGVGSGGGEHAKLARRDIESCVACHDVNGSDPTCIMCHTDADGIKGTNPRTHEAGFMKNVHGDWHNDNASVCFTCHVNTHTPGIGFCGYCHSNNVGK
jgi:hypothetical protein